jgi:hypothetical protein
MKLTRNTEWAVIAALIVYIAFTPGMQVVKDILATPLGKAAVLATIVYVWKFVSPIIAILLTISFMRCAKWNVWEGFSGAETACTCENSAAIWDSQSKTCKDATGNAAGAVKTCTCTNGYAWDGGEKGKKQCIPVTNTQAPVPPTENPVAASLDQESKDAKAAEAAIVPTPEPKTETTDATTPASKPTEGFANGREFFGGIGTSLFGAAPVADGRKGPSEVPMTTGSAGAALVRDRFVPSGGYGGVQPSGGQTSSVPASA